MPPAFAPPAALPVHATTSRRASRSARNPPLTTARKPAGTASPPQNESTTASHPPPTTPPPAPHAPRGPSAPRPTLPPPGLELIAHDARVIFSFFRSFFDHGPSSPSRRPRSAAGTRAASMYASTLGAGSRFAERAALRAGRATAGWRSLRPFQWQLAADGEGAAMREEWVRKVEAFVRGSEGGVVGVVWRKSVSVVVGALGAAEHVVRRVAASKNVRGVLESVTERVVKGVLAAELGARSEVGLAEEAGRLAEGVVGNMAGVKRARGDGQARRKAAATVARVALRGGVSRSGSVALRTGVVSPGTAKAVVTPAITAPSHEPATTLGTASAAATAAPPREITSSPSSFPSRPSPSGEPQPARWRATLLRAGAAILFAAAAAGVAGASLPGALTVSAVAVTAAAATRGAEKRHEVGRASAIAMFERRSWVGRGVVRAVGSAGRQRAKVTEQTRSAPARLQGVVEGVVRREEGSVVGNGVIEAKAYQVGETVPKVLAAPVVGAVLSGLDDVAFVVEQVVGRVARRLGGWGAEKVDGWTLLGSFERREGW